MRRDFDGFGNGATEAPCRAREFGVDLLSDFCRHRRRRGDARAVCAHDFAAERLLLVGAFHHIDFAVQAKIGASHRKGRSPLSGSGFGRHAFQTLLLCVVGLGDRRVELVAAARVVAFELVVDLCRRSQLLFETVGAHEWRRAIHLVEVADFFGNGNPRVGIVELLPGQFRAKDRGELFERKRLVRPWMKQRRGLVLHVGANIVPCARNLVFREIDLVGNFFFAHSDLLNVS